LKIVDLSVKRPVGVIMLVLGVIVLGMISFMNIPVDLYPDLDVPIAVVATTYSGAAPQEVERQVTEPIEAALSTVQGVDTIQSNSTAGSSLVILQLDWGADLDEVLQSVRENVDMISESLPEGANDPRVMRIDPTAIPVMWLGLEGDEPENLQRLAEDVVEPRLERVEGVASVTIEGGKEREIIVEVDDTLLSAYQLTPNQIIQAISQENQAVSGGNLMRGGQELQLRIDGQYETLDDLKETLIPLPRGGHVRLGDVAEVKETYKESQALSYVNGEPALVFSVLKESDANTVAVADGVFKAMNGIQNALPDGINLNVIFDMSQFIRDAIDNVVSNMLVGGLLAVLVLLFFLRSIRGTLVIAVTIPIAVISTFALMYFTGETVNMITMGGLALGVGMMVDSAIVILEGMFSYREKGHSLIESARLGASELGPAVIASTLTTVAVFVPIVFVKGIAAEIFGPLGLTVSFSLFSSLVAAMTLVPMIFSRLPQVKQKRGKRRRGGLFRRRKDQPQEAEPILAEAALDHGPEAGEKRKGEQKEQVERLVQDEAAANQEAAASEEQGGLPLPAGYQLPKIKAFYKRVLSWALDHRKTTVAIVFLLLLASLSAIPFIGATFIPMPDQGQISVIITTREGSAQEETLELGLRASEVLEETFGDDLKTYFMTVGGTTTGFQGGASNRAEFIVQLVPSSEREITTAEAIGAIEEALSNIAGIETSVFEMTSGYDAGSPITVQIRGHEWDVLEEISNEVAWIVENVEGTREVQSSINEGQPELRIEVDREMAAQYGITYQQVMQEVMLRFNGQQATIFRSDGDEVDVIVALPEERRQTIQDIESMYMRAATGELIPLSTIARLHQVQGPTEIQRQDQERQVNVTAELSGRDLASVVADIQAQLDKLSLPEGYEVSIGGQAEEMADAFGSLTQALILSIFLVYMVMAVQFESFVYPFIIMFSLPTTVIGVLVGLFVTQTPLSVTAFIGLIMLAGIVVNNAIVLVDYINTLRRRDKIERTEAILMAGQSRLRPILMTTVTTLLGMLPLALGIGEGTETQAPLAIVIIFGLSFSTVFTLVFVPVIYVILDNLSNRVKSWFVSEPTTRVNDPMVQ
jgi:HAE1 family hydrophobic/amphiphilic exporter-1